MTAVEGVIYIVFTVIETLEKKLSMQRNRIQLNTPFAEPFNHFNPKFFNRLLSTHWLRYSIYSLK